MIRVCRSAGWSRSARHGDAADADPLRTRRPGRSRAERRALAPSFGAELGTGEGADVVIEAAGTTEAWERALELRPARRHRARLRRPATRGARARRPLPDPLRGGDAEGRLPPHAAARANGADVPRQRRVSLRAADHPPARARGRGGASSPTRRTTTSRRPRRPDGVAQPANSVSSGSRSPRRTARSTSTQRRPRASASVRACFTTFVAASTPRTPPIPGSGRIRSR